MAKGKALSAIATKDDASIKQLATIALKSPKCRNTLLRLWSLYPCNCWLTTSPCSKEKMWASRGIWRNRSP